MKTILPVLLATFTIVVSSAPADERPNIVLIMVDDLGFSDLGYHGGEIDTPNVDALALGGVRFSQFYNSGRCCPTRASLMTGLHPHQTGIGHMTSPPLSDQHDLGVPGYRGFLNDRCVTIAEVLRSAGYATLMTGKWHLGYDRKECWPLQRGFDKYYGCISGATRFFHPEQPRGMTLGNENLENPESTTDREFYTTDAFTDYAIRFVEEHLEGERSQSPFFLYLAYTAPHWPLQAFEEDVAKYRGRYRIGWDELRRRRCQRQIELGLIDPAWKLSAPTEGIPRWETLDQKKQDEMDLKMAVYAAMVDRVDQNLGKLVASLKASKTYDNTLILFLSDNGACQEGGMLGRGEFYDVQRRNLEHSNSYGEAWANASSTPFRLYKHFVHEGGAATPFFMHWPARIAPRAPWYDQPAQLIDILPTLIDLAGASVPSEFRGQPVPPLEGISLRPAFDGRPLDRSAPIFLEHENNAAIRDGDWKLVGRNVAPRQGVDPSRWELYNLGADRTETNDLASEHPGKLRELAEQWNHWAERVGVYPKEASPAPQAEPDPPQVAGRALTVTATVRHKKPQGVVLSHGGVRFGYALHFVDGRPAFSIRNQGKLTELIAEEPVSGKVTVRASLDGETLTLAVDSQPVAQRRSPGLLASQPGIGLYLGQDFQDPVGNYEVPSQFNGVLLAHRVDVALPEVMMRTPWGEQLGSDPTAGAWQEYPRPAMRRDHWINLNGWWSYAVTSKDAAVPETWDGEIRVPFAIEAPLSGVERRFTPEDALWYRRAVTLEKQDGRRYRLHFEAVDYQSTVWINGRKSAPTPAATSRSRSTSPTLCTERRQCPDVTRHGCHRHGAYQLHGKQRRGPQRHLVYSRFPASGRRSGSRTVPACTSPLCQDHALDVDGSVAIALANQPPDRRPSNATVTASLDGGTVATVRARPGRSAQIPEPQLWSPESPTLYDLDRLGDDASKSYTGLREPSVKRDATATCAHPQRQEIFHWGTLDQGWWPDGLLTPPSDEAMRSDIEFLKAAGFNTIRKHIKVEPRRYYTHCDRHRDAGLAGPGEPGNRQGPSQSSRRGRACSPTPGRPGRKAHPSSWPN
jgi:arylsulfatase A-like enzyme